MTLLVSKGPSNQLGFKGKRETQAEGLGLSFPFGYKNEKSWSRLRPAFGLGRFCQSVYQPLAGPLACQEPTQVSVGHGLPFQAGLIGLSGYVGGLSSEGFGCLPSVRDQFLDLGLSGFNLFGEDCVHGSSIGRSLRRLPLNTKQPKAGSADTSFCMEWQIKGRYQGRVETIDSYERQEDETREEAEREVARLVSEYRMAYGPGWSVWSEEVES